MATDASSADDAEPPPRVQLELAYLHECYNAVLLRRVERGRVSIRTRPGYELLRSKYQPRVRFLHDADAQSGDSSATGSALSDSASRAETPQDVDGLHASSEPLATRGGNSSEVASHDDGERTELERVVGVYFDPRIKRFVTDVCWPLAHFGGAQHGRSSSELQPPSRKPVPEWQELAREKYFVFTFQDQAERDWQRDCEFDAYGRDGLSFEGFVISLLDLATACTTGSVDACLEFLQLMAQRLQTALPAFRDPTCIASSSGGTEPHPGEPLDEIAWRTIPLERLTPCQLRPKAQYYELKAKRSPQPLVLMVLLGNERPAELQLSTSAKLLIRERDSRMSVRRQTIALKAHFVELEKQFLWTFRSLGDRPSLLMIPNHCISRRTLTLYACLRLIDGRELELQREARQEREDPASADAPSTTPSLAPILTLFSSIQDPFPLVYGAANCLCGRIDRQTARMFAIDHRARTAPFTITLKTSLIQNTTSGGGAGAAAVLAALLPPSPSSSPRSTSRGDSSSSSSDATTAHSFVFVVKYHDDAAMRPSARVQKLDATLPQQWYTTLSGTCETKSVVIDDPIWARSSDAVASKPDSPDSEDALPSAAGLYYLYIFSLHGFYFEVQYDDVEELEQKLESSSDGATSLDHSTAGNGASVASDAADGANSINTTGESTDADAALVSSSSICTSASLLRRLLLLRKRRQRALTAEPPPKVLEGSKVTHVKTASVAETLKSKFLCARATERQLRLNQHADAEHAKVIATLERSSKKHVLFAGASGKIQHNESSAQVTATADAAVNAETSEYAIAMDAHVALLSEFFKDMAAFQPSQQDALEEQAHQAVADEREGALLEHFAEFFENDTALQNFLDEENKSTDVRATRLVVRRSAEGTKQLSTSKDKSLSAVTLTKKTNSLVSDVEELKSNLKELQVQSRDAEQQDQTLQDLVAKVERLQNAFDSLSDVVIEEIDGIQKTHRALQSKLDSLDDSVASLQDHVARVDGKRRLLQDSADRRFEVAQDTFGKFAMSLYESQSELMSVKHTAEQMLSREREAAHALQRLESSHEQVAESVQRLRQDCTIAKECGAVRTSASQSSSQVIGKLETLREALERQAKLDRSQWSQRLDVLSENLATYEHRSKDAFATLLKNHSRIRVALDEGMGISASELRTLAHDVQTRQSEHERKLEALSEQLATHTIDAMRKHQDLEAALRVVAAT